MKRWKPLVDYEHNTAVFFMKKRSGVDGTVYPLGVDGTVYPIE